MSDKKVKPNPLKAELRLDVDARLAAMTNEDRDRQSKIILSKIFAHPKYKSAKRISLFLSLPTEVPTEPILNDILARGDAAFVPQYSRGQMKMLRVLPGDLELMVETSWKIKQHSKDAVREDAMENGKIYCISLNLDSIRTAVFAGRKEVAESPARRFRTAFVPQYSRGQMKMLRVLPVDLELMVETSWKIKQHSKDAVREDAMENGLDLVIAPGAAFTRDGWRCGHGGGYYDRYLTALRARHADRDLYVLAVGFNQQIYPEIPVDINDVKVDEVLTAE
ncbi:5-formyltetrahydrofolate cyclo-ligase-like [Cydia pomonella]|uniref:5-formyltetrahydrofolate cyclo-ligase-like n=1 Tax=Cydia pomonella TaxID=82600 RepID=UPI002ADDA48F|nr:5-formyltetrahydrofolate cyclo-ligase-like [Cydia pomonella]